jgi:uncharacterized repeat protein (TIGR01451 family)
MNKINKHINFFVAVSIASMLVFSSVFAGTPSGTQIQNVAKVVYHYANGQPDTLGSNLTSIVVNSTGVLTLSKTTSSTNVLTGDTVLYRIIVGNTGEAPLSNVHIVDTLASSLSFISTTRGIVSGNVISWNIDTLKEKTVDTAVIKARILPTVSNNTFIRNKVYGFDGLGGVIADSVRVLAQNVIDYSCQMGITVDPNMVIGNGISSAVITAFISDTLGNPKPDGTPVYFSTSLGFFSNNQDSIVGYTVGGWVKDSIRALIATNKIYKAIAVVSTRDANICSKLDSITILFYPGAIKGRIVNDDDDQPVANVKVIVRSSAGDIIDSIITARDGKYLVPVPKTDNYQVTFSTMNVLNQTITSTINIPVTVPGTGGVPAVLQSNMTTGTIYYLVSGKPIPIPGLKLFLIPKLPSRRVNMKTTAVQAPIDSTVTDSMGVYHFKNIAVGTYEVVLQDAQLSAVRALHMLSNGQYVINSNCPVLLNPNVIISKNGPIQASNIDTVTYTIQVQNIGTLPLSNTRLIDSLDQSMIYQGSSNNGTYDASGHRVIWNVGAFDSLSSKNYTVAVTLTDTLPAMKNVINRVWISSDEIYPISAEAQTSVRKAKPSLEILKTASQDTLNPQDIVSYYVYIRNNGNVRLTNVTLVDTINAAYLTPIAVDKGQLVGNIVRWTIAVMDTMAIDTIHVTAQLNKSVIGGQNVINTAYAQTQETSHTVYNAQAAIYVRGNSQASQPKLELVKIASSDTVLVGNEVAYTILIRNAGNVTLTNVQVIDTLTTAMTPIGAIHAQLSKSIVIYNVDSLRIGQSDTVTIKARVRSDRPNKESIVNRVFGKTDQTNWQDTSAVIISQVIVQDKSCRIHLLAHPSTLLGDGIKTSKIEAFLTDTLGNPKPDGTPVFFKTPIGTFSNGLDSIIVPTIDGYAVDSLKANVTGIGIIETFAKVSASDADVCSAIDSIKIVFYPGAIEGIVTDNRTNLPVENALVKVFESAGTWQDSTRTPADGSYSIPIPRSGSYRVTITITDNFGKQVSTQSNVPVKVPNIVKNKNSISGKVYFVVSNKPVEARYVKVELQKVTYTGGLGKSMESDAGMVVTTMDTTTTDSSGTYVFPVDSITIVQTSTFRIKTLDRFIAGSIDIIDMTFGKYIINANIPIDLQANMVLRKTASDSIVYVKDVVDYTILVADTGNLSTTNAIVVDSLGAGMSLVSAGSISSGVTIDTSDRKLIKFSIGTLDSLGGVRDTVLLKLKVRFDDTISTNMSAINTVIFTSNEASRITAEANVNVIVPQLQITKETITKIVDVGDVATYKITISNRTSVMTLSNVQVIDYIPFGFKYIAGSSFRGSQKLSDPFVGKELRWAYSDSLKPDSSIVFVYRLVAGAGAAEGNGINTARATALTPSGKLIQSALVSARIEVRKGIFTDHGMIIGKVFYDNNRNAYQDPNEEGVKGVELVTEDGTRITTGDDGKYSLPDVLPGMHVIKVRKQTIPGNAVLITGYNDFAGIPSSRFVDVTPSGIARADFYLASIQPDTVVLSQSIAKVGDIEIQRISEPRNVVFIEDEKPALMKLSGVNFDIGKATLRPESFPILKQIAEILNQYSDVTATIIGHTDSSPIKTREFANNKQLSVARAQSVKKYLAISERIDTSRIGTLGFGETQPIADNKTKEGKAANRRVEISFNQDMSPVERTTQSIVFKIPIRYDGSTPVDKIEMKDELDPRLQYVEGSATIGDSLITPSVNGNSLEWTIDSIGTKFNKMLVYRAVVQKPENKIITLPSHTTSFRYYVADTLFTSVDTLHTVNEVAVAIRGRAVNYVLSGVLFDVAKSTLRSSAVSALSSAAEVLNRYPSTTALIEGHTDSNPIHTAEYPSNNELSVARAKTIVNKLASEFGIDSSRLRYMGFGSYRPLESNKTAQGRQANRRVEIRILTKAFVEQVIPEGFVDSSDVQRTTILPKYHKVKFDSTLIAQSGDKLILQLQVRRPVSHKTLETIVIDSLPLGLQMMEKNPIATFNIDTLSHSHVVKARCSAVDSMATIFILLDVVAPVDMNYIEQDRFYVVRKERHGAVLIDKANPIRIEVYRKEQ